MEVIIPAVVVAATVLVAIGFPVLIGYFILKPYQQAVRGKKLRTQFLLTDFFWLLVQLQLALGFIVSQSQNMHSRYFFTALVFLVFAVIGMWCGAVAALSRAGIRHTFRRGVFILVLVPGVVGLMMGTAMVFLGTIFGLMGWGTDQGVFGLVTSVRRAAEAAVVLSVGFVLAIVLCRLLRRLTRWLIQPAEQPAASA